MRCSKVVTKEFILHVSRCGFIFARPAMARAVAYAKAHSRKTSERHDCQWLRNVTGVLVISNSWSIPWLLIPWLLASPGHQQPWRWTCLVTGSLSSTRKKFIYQYHHNIRCWHDSSFWLSRRLLNKRICLTLMVLFAFNSLKPDDAYLHQRTGSPLTRVMACLLSSAKVK